MNSSKFFVPRWGGAVGAILLIAVAPAALAANITLSLAQPAGSDWNTPNWSDGNGASVSAAANPSNTYEILPGSRLRSPNNGTDDTFPGQSLTISGDGIWANPSGATTSEIRFKQVDGPNGPGRVTFPKLIMNGGQLDTGNDSTIAIDGEIDIVKNASFYNDGPNDRGYQIDALLTGTAPIEWHAYVQPGFMTTYTHDLNITGNSNTFSGKWNVVFGTLLGTGTNALGTNDINVAVNGALETTYDINNPQGSLQLNGQMFLHQDDSFRSVTIGTTALTKGTHTFDELSATFTNFPATWTPQVGAEDFTDGSGSITVLNDNTTPVTITQGLTNTTVQVGTSATFTIGVSGPVVGTQWYSNNVAIAGANSLSYTTPLLTLASDQTIYKVVLTNAVNSVESSVTVTVSLAPKNITISVQQAAGFDWNSTGYWSDGNPASASAAANPLNTYEMLAGSRLRSPNNGTDDTFPGSVLTLSGSGVWVNNPGAGTAVSELRFKQLATDGTVRFPKLVMNGGQLDTGNGGTVTIDGEIDIVKNAPFYNDDVSDRGYIIAAKLTGTNSIEYHGYNLAGYESDFSHNLNIAGNSNTFSGQWNIVLGTLLGTGTNALGTNDINIGLNGALETTYDINDTTGSLNLNGQMFLHQNDTFRTVSIGGVALAKGTYTFDQLAAYTNFPSSWTPQIGADAFSTGSGSITVLENNSIPVAITSAPVSSRVLLGQTATFTAQITGPATNIQWFANNVAIPGANSLTYTTAPATATDDNTIYKIVVDNNVNSVNASATLTIGLPVLSTGFFKDEVWFGTQYTDQTVLQDPGFLDTPTVTRYLTSFETPSTQGDNYIERVSGLFTPAVSGNYVFFLSSDDQSGLFLSTDTNSANKIQIAAESAYSDVRSWLSSSGSSVLADKRSDTYSGATSFNGGAPGEIQLTAGQSYYIEADHREGTGGDNLAATFKLASAADPQNGTASTLAGSLISTIAIDGGTLTITNAPVSVTVTNGGSATFSVGVQSSSTGILYQWQRNGQNIAGGNQSTYTTPAATSADDQAQYRVVITIPGIPPVTSTAATLTVGGGQVTPTAVTIKSGQAANGNFSFAFASQLGVHYSIEYKNALSDSVWQTLPSVVGTGTDITISDALSASARFYRVGAQ